MTCPEDSGTIGPHVASRAAHRQPPEVTTRRRLLRWMGWFALVNVALLALVGLRYLWYYATLGPSVAWIYALLAFVGQMSAFAYVPLLCLVPSSSSSRDLGSSTPSG